MQNVYVLLKDKNDYSKFIKSQLVKQPTFLIIVPQKFTADGLQVPIKEFPFISDYLYNRNSYLLKKINFLFYDDTLKKHVLHSS